MRLIKNCPSCHKVLRFPIDKGKIKIKCSCGYNFYADPDDPVLYKNSEIDPSINRKQKSAKRKTGNIIKIISESSLNFYYQILNFKIFSAVDRGKVFTKILIILVIIGLIMYYIIIKTREPVIL